MTRPAAALAAALLAAAAFAAGCDSGPPSPCSRICDLEARCTEAGRTAGDDKRRFDAGECAAACKALERDADGKKLVAAHVACVTANADDCPAVLACP